MLRVHIFGRDCCSQHKISRSPCACFHTNICYAEKILLAYKPRFSTVLFIAELANCKRLSYCIFESNRYFTTQLMLELTTNKKSMPYRGRMRIISLLGRREILIICIWSSRIGHGDQYNDIDIIFTCMKTICYDFEDSVGIPHSPMSVKEPLLACGTRGTPIPPAQEEQPCRGTRAVWGDGGPCWDPGHERQHLCSALDHWKLTCFSSAEFPEITLNAHQTLKEQAKATQTCYSI